MNNNELYHYGIPGMRWGHRKSKIEKISERSKKRGWSDDATEAAIRAKGEEVYNTRLKELEAQSEAKRQKGQEARREYRATEQTKKLEEAQLKQLQKEHASISTNADILKTKQSELAKLETKLRKAQPWNKRKATKEQEEYIKELKEKKKNLEKEIKYYSSQQPDLWDTHKQDLVSQIAEQQKNIEEIQEALKLKRAKRAEIAKESGGKAELEEILKEGLKVTIKDKDGKEITSIYQPTIPEGKKVNDVLEEIAGRLKIIRKAGGTIRLMKSGGISGVGHKGSSWEATIGKSTWNEIIKKLEENGEKAYKAKFHKTHEIHDLEKYELGTKVSIAGRMIFKRTFGKLIFARLYAIGDNFDVDFSSNIKKCLPMSH